MPAAQHAAACGALLVLVAAAAVPAQNLDPFGRIDRELSALASQAPGVAVAVSVAQDGRIVWEAGYGYSDAARTVRTTAHTPFAVGSVAKTVTAMALMRLAERGLVDLDRPVHTYLGDEVRVLQGDRSRLTPAALAGNAAGIPHLSRHYWNDDAATALTSEALVREYGIAVFPPGESFHYSNMSFGVIERLIEKVTGVPFQVVVAQEVFRPLGMENSFFATPTEPRHYAVRLSSSGVPVEGYVFTEPEAGAGLVASAHDLARLGALHSGRPIGSTRVLAESSIERMHRPVHPEASYGLGMWVSDYAFIFDGSVLGGAGIVKVIPSEGLAVAVVTNAATANPATYRFIGPIIDALLDSRGRKARDEPVPVFHLSRPFVLSPAYMGRWVGQVHHQGGVTAVTLVIDGDGVQASLGDDRLVAVEPTVDEGRLRLAVFGRLDQSEPAGRVTILVQPFGSRLVGFARAPASPRSGLAFPRQVELNRQ